MSKPILSSSGRPIHPQARKQPDAAPQHYRPKRLKGAERVEHGTEWAVAQGDAIISPQPDRATAFEQARQLNTYDKRDRKQYRVKE